MTSQRVPTYAYEFNDDTPPSFGGASPRHAGPPGRSRNSSRQSFAQRSGYCANDSPHQGMTVTAWSMTAAGGRGLAAPGSRDVRR